MRWGDNNIVSARHSAEPHKTKAQILTEPGKFGQLRAVEKTEIFLLSLSVCVKLTVLMKIDASTRSSKLRSVRVVFTNFRTSSEL